MKSKRKLKNIIRIMAVVMFTLTTAFPVYATETNTEYNSKFTEALKTYLGTQPTSEELYRFSTIISTLKTDGFSNDNICGIMGNLLHEGSNPYSVEGVWAGDKVLEDVDTGESGLKFANLIVGHHYKIDPDIFASANVPHMPRYNSNSHQAGNGHGIAQWSGTRRDNLFEFAKTQSTNSDHPFGVVIITHDAKLSEDEDWFSMDAYIPDVVGQCMFMILEFADGYKGCKQNILNSESIEDACRIFCDQYEKPTSPNYDVRIDTAEAMLPVVEACTGIVGSIENSVIVGENAETSAESISNFAFSMGIWSEDTVSAFNKLTEGTLDSASIDNLSYDQRESLDLWQDMAKEDGISKLIHIARLIVVGLGIALMTYSVLLYLAYWLDRVNTVFSFSLLSILSFNRLVWTTNDDEVTWLNKEKGAKKTVNHKIMLVILILGVAFGIMIVSGAFFNILKKIVTFVFSKMGIVK